MSLNEPVPVSVDCVGCPEETSQCVATNTGNVVCMCRDGLIDVDPHQPGTNCSRSPRESPPSTYCLALVKTRC